MARCLTILADGLRPDAITPAGAPCLTHLTSIGASALRARTVRPSVTVAALTSLATGVSPRTHGLTQPGLGFLSRVTTLRPLGRELRRHGVPVVVAAGPLSAGSRAVAWALASYAGVERLACAERGAAGIVQIALAEWAAFQSGLLFVYLPDCDQAGHAHGWMSPPYLEAVAAVDDAVGRLVQTADDALLLVVADHGGGGVTPTDHDAPHPLNDRIPLIMTGPGVRRATLAGEVSLLDVPPTLLAWFDLPIPEGYEGRALTEAFALAEAPAA